MDLYTCNINPRENVDENIMYLYWTSTDDRVDKLDHFVPLMNDLNPPPLKQTKYVKREVYVPVTNSLLEGKDNPCFLTYRSVGIFLLQRIDKMMPELLHDAS